MSRKSLILCLSALAALLVGLAISIAFLYSGTGNRSDKKGVSYEGSRSCLCMIPSDAVLVSNFGRVDDACGGVLSGIKFPSLLSERISDGSLASLKRSSLAVSLHYAGKISSLYVMNLSKVTDEAEANLKDLVSECGFFMATAGDYIAISESETLVKAALRHYEKNVSIADAPGFDKAIGSLESDDVLIVSNLHMQKIMPSLFTRTISTHSSFLERVSDWMAFDMASASTLPVLLSGGMLFDGDADEFMSVFAGCEPGMSEIADVLPSYTQFALTLPLKGHDVFANAYRTFIDSRQGLHNFLAAQKSLANSAGISPEAFFEKLGVREIGSASFVVGSKMEKVNLIRISNKDAEIVFKGNEVDSFRNYVPAVHSWAYPSFIASVYGKYFSLPDESCFTYVDGWIVSGSRAAIEEYVERDALGYTLNEYMEDAGKGGMLSSEPALAFAYFSFTENPDGHSQYLKKGTLDLLSGLVGDCDYAPVVLSVGKVKKDITLSCGVRSLTLQKSKAPSFDRDTVVTVPTGPFQVRNSHTGKMNTFYQNAQKAICLRDETGKDLWGVPFGKSLCGTAHNVDYFANGKLQIIFGAGSSVYVIDRLGRYVSGFPIDLGKEIVLGPDIYDFSGAKKYNIMVLHKDNTIHMYNLKGKKPEAWKGITAKETIKALPQRLTVGDKDFWIVRTSIQTLIFPFYGGEPLTVFEGNAMIRPDSEVKVLDGTSVQVVNYDGKTKTISLVK
jgi:hypothetical protein